MLLLLLFGIIRPGCFTIHSKTNNTFCFLLPLSSFFPLHSLPFNIYSIIRLYRTRLYRNSVYIEVQSAVPSDKMLINTKGGYIDTRINRSIYHGPLNFDITELYCIYIPTEFLWSSLHLPFGFDTLMSETQVLNYTTHSRVFYSSRPM